jgi:CRISPR-associated protein Csx10
MKRWELTLVSRDPVAVGARRERGFHVPTQSYLPGGTVRGALAAHWIARNGQPGPNDRKFAAQVAQLLVSPAYPDTGKLIPLDHDVCKYRPIPACQAVAVAHSDAEHQTCPACHGQLEASKGRWANVAVERTTRTALNPDETAMDEHLYRRDALAPGQVFQAVAWGDLAWLAPNTTLRVGGRRTVGGRMPVTAQEAPPTPPAVSGNVLRVQALSPAVFCDEFGANQLAPTPTDLARTFAVTPERAPTLVGQWSRPEVVGGWNASGGLPKASEWAVCPGSVFALDFARPVTADQASAVARQGIGLRRADGYGWFSVGPWTPPRQAQPEPIPVEYSGATKLAEQVGAVGTRFTRRCVGWLREGVSLEDVSSAVSYTSLSPADKGLVERVLRYNHPTCPEPERRRLMIALEVRT